MSSRESSSSSPLKRPYDRTNGETIKSPSEVDASRANCSTSSKQISEIRSLKKIHKSEETSENFMDIKGIVHPVTKEIISVGEAINLRILDVRNGRISTSIDGKTSVTIKEAAILNLIDDDLAKRLLGPCGITDDGRRISLLEAIQREILDAERGDDRVKVNYQSTGGISVADAMNTGLLDPETGHFITASGERISIAEAYSRGYLTRISTDVNISQGSLALSDAISHGLVDDRQGRIMDRNTGDAHLLDEAIAIGIIDPEVREVVDTRNDTKITVAQAIEQGLLNPKSGKYLDEKSMEKLTFKEARRRSMIVKPLTLKDCCDLEIIDETGKISSPARQTKLGILEAITRGVLDSDRIKSITDDRTDEKITLDEALASGIILPDGKYKDGKEELISIPDAVDRGLIISVAQKSIFDIEGFKDPVSGEWISLNTALLKGLVSPKAGGSFVTDLKSGKTLLLNEAVDEGHARPEVMEMLNRGIGVTENGREVSVIEAVLLELLDPKTGQLLDPRSKKIVPLKEAIRRGLITPDGAALLASLLNITVTSQTMTKTVKKYVTVTETGETITRDYKFSYSEAVARNLVNQQTDEFHDPDTGRVMRVQEAISQNLLGEDKRTKEPKQVTFETIIDSSPRAIGTTTTIITRDIVSPNRESSIISETSLSISPSAPSGVYKTVLEIRQTEYDPKREDSSAEEETKLIQQEAFELPPGGWMLAEVIERKLLDPETGMCMIPGTDRLVPFQECVKLGIINSNSAIVIDPNNRGTISLLKSLEQGVLDSKGRYNPAKITLKEAINRECVILENRIVEVECSSPRLLQITKVTGEPDRVEISTIDDPTKSAIVNVSEERNLLDPVQIKPGVIYDPSTALVIFTESGKSTDILTAVNDGALQPEFVVIKDPRSGEEIPVKEAIRQGILDSDQGKYKGKNGKGMSLADATKLGLVAVLGAPLVAAAAAVEAVKKAMIEDPRTGEKIPREVAIERGLVKPEVPLSLGEKTRARVTTEPKFKVTIGRAISEDEAKPIILQKMRKKIIRPKEASESGLMDRETAKVLETKLSGDDGEPLTLLEAIKSEKIDANRGRIVDPQTGEALTIKEAFKRGILDSESGDMFVPIAKSISIPDLYKQGLIDPQGEIIHPETGMTIKMTDAIVCEILDPNSKIVNPRGEKLTIESAIVSNVIDPVNSVVKTENGDMSLIKAIEAKVFDTNDLRNLSEIPPIGMTFPVALNRGLIDMKKKEVIHPVTGERLTLEEAINTDFIMTVPFPEAPDSTEVNNALDSSLIDKGVFQHPKTGEQLPVTDAIETGVLVIKPQTENIGTIKAVTETITSYHSKTSETVQIAPNFALVSPTEVQDLSTGKILPLDEAKKKGIARKSKETEDTVVTFTDAVEQGLVNLETGVFTDPDSGKVIPIAKAIETGKLETAPPIEKIISGPLTVLEAFEQIYDEKAEKFHDPVSKRDYNLSEAIQVGLIEPDSVVYDVKSAEAVTTKQAIEKGLLDPKTGKMKVSSGSSMSVADAAKLGLLAVVAAPILAGKAVIDAVRDKTNKGDKNSGTIPKRQNPKDSKRSSLEKEIPESKKVVKEDLPTLDKVDLQGKASAKNLTADLLSTESEDQEAMESTIVTTVQEAIENERIDPRTCRIFIRGKEVPETTIHTGLEQHEISLTDSIEIFSKTKVELLEDKSLRIRITKELTPENLAELGAYNLEAERFADPSTGNLVSFNEFVLSLEIFDPDNVQVRDITSKGDKFLSLRKAIERPLLDRNIGYMVDPKSGKKIPFFEAVRLGWIAENRTDTSSELLSLEEIIESGACNPVTGEVYDNSGNTLSLANAIRNDLIDPDSISVRNPLTDEIIPLTEAIDSGIVDLIRETIVNSETKTETELNTGMSMGFLVPRQRKPISLEAVINLGLYEPETGKILDKFANQFIDIEEGVRRGIVDAFITECKDTKSGSFLSLDDALTVKLIIPLTGRLRDTKNGTLLPLNKALNQGLIITTPFIPSLIDTIVQEYYSPKTGLILNPATGDELTVAKALSSGFVDGRMVKIKDEKQDKAVSIQEAQEEDILDLKKGILLYPHSMTLDVAFEKGYILSTVKPWTLQEALAHHCYDPQTGRLIIDGDVFTLEEAITRGIITPDSPSVKDPRSGNIISLNDAIKHGVIDPKSGTALDPISGIPLSLTDALDRGLVVPAKRKISLPEAVFKGFYDPKTGQFTSPETQEKLPTDRAIQKGVLDPASAIVRDGDGEVITFRKAIKESIVDPKAGTVTNSRGHPIDFHEAFEQGILLETRRPMSFSEAIFKGILDESGTFLDPQSGHHLTLIETIRNNLIDADSVIVKDTRAEVWRKITLMEAIETGYIDGRTGKVKNPEGMEISLVEAYHTGIIIDKKAAVSLQRAIHQGLYDEKTGKIIDPSTGRSLTLHEAMRKCIINPVLACYYDKRTERVLSLAETCRAGVIDRRAGTFKDPTNNRTLSLTTTLQTSLIIDIESTNFTLYDALLMNMYDTSNGKFIHPSTNQKLLLSEACQEMINPQTSIVKNSKTNQYIPLVDAIAAGLVDNIRGTYQIPNSSQVLNLQEARKKGLIVPYRKPLSLEEAIKCHIYSAGKFTDPLTNKSYNLSEALENGLIDPETTALKDATTGQLKTLLEGIQDQTIDIMTGSVLDRKTNRTYRYDIALERGLLVSVEHPKMDDQQKIERPTECTLSEAIRDKLIDPNTSFVKDPKSGRYIPVSAALNHLIDPTVKGTIPTEERPHCVKFEKFVIFLDKPISFPTAIDNGHLVLETSKFTDPRTKAVLTLKEAITTGAIDPDSALIKDTEKKRLVKLPEAFRKGMMDAEKGNVLDTSTSRLYTLSKAIDLDLLVTQKQGISFIETLQYGLYDPLSGRFSDPFANSVDGQRLTLTEAIDSLLIDPSTTVIKDPVSGDILSLLEAINEGKVDPIGGKIFDNSDHDEGLDFIKGMEHGFILAAEARVSDVFYLCFLIHGHHTFFLFFCHKKLAIWDWKIFKYLL